MKNEKGEKKKLASMNPVEQMQFVLGIMKMKIALINNTLKGEKIPKELKEALEQEVPVFHQTKDLKELKEYLTYPPNPMFMTLASTIKQGISNELFERVEIRQKEARTVRGYIR